MQGALSCSEVHSVKFIGSQRVLFCPDDVGPVSTSGATHMNLEAYLPVILFILVGVGVGIAPQVLGFLLGPNRPDAAKNSPYECGFEAFEDARMKFDVRYYLVAILFILFDLEIAFLFPWAVSLREIGATGFWAMMVFLGILVVGFAYEWKKGALDWE
jgi:NADH-quinone oxidoreductase subunit A